MDRKSNTKRNILFLPDHEVSFNELLRIAVYLKKHDIAVPKVLISNDRLRSKKGMLTADEIGYVDLLGDADKKVRLKNDSLGSAIRGLLKKSQSLYHFAIAVKDTIDTTGCFHKKRQAQISLLLQKRLTAIKRLLAEVNPVSVVVPGDRHQGEGWVPALLKACRDLQIPVVIPPISMAANIESLPVTRRNRKIFRADKFPEIKRRYPRQYIYDDVSRSNILFYPFFEIEALAENGMLPENPWVMGGGDSTYVLAEGEKTRDRYLDLGCAPGKIIVTGHPAHDHLFALHANRQKLKAVLNERYAFDERKKLIILALPQLAEHRIMDWKSHWNEIRFLCQTFSRQQANCLISLHPKMEFGKYQAIAAEYNIAISRSPLSEILPAADIFAATFSSTIQWAVLCQIPSVVFDFYGLNYSMYDFLTGTKIVNRKNALESELIKLLKNESYYYHMAAEQKRLSNCISPFDGRCMERIADVIFGGMIPDE